MKTFYLTTHDAFDAGHALFLDSAFIDGPGNTIIVAASFRNQDDELRWSSQPHVHPLPHGLSGQAVASLPAAIQTILGNFGIVATDTLWDIAGKLAALHPGMSLR